MKGMIRRERVTRFLRNPLMHRASLFIVVVILLNLLYPAGRSGTPVLKEGNIADKDYIAPYTFAIRKSKEELEKERKQAMELTAPVLRLDENAKTESLRRLSVFFQNYEGVDSLTRATIEANKSDFEGLAENVVMQIMKRGVVDDLNSIDFGSKREVAVKRKGGEETRTDIFDLGSAIMFTKEKGMELLGGDEEKVRALVEIVRHSIKPNLIYMGATTVERRRLAAEGVKTTKGVVLKGEMIVRAHDPITKEAIEKLSSLAVETGEERVNTELFGRNLLFVLSLLILFTMLYFIKREVLFDTKKLLFIAIVSLLIVSASSILVRREVSPYLIPVAMGSVLFTILIGEGPAIASIIPLSFILAMFMGLGTTRALFPLSLGIISIFVASRVRKFSDFSKAIPFLAVISIVIAGIFEVYKGVGYKSVVTSLGFAALGGIGSGVLALGLLPLFERAFGITTDLTLVELTDLNHPLLKALSTQAPGTYNHSMLIASMVESAASSVFANSLLARAGAYYHDIGKLKNPQYFIENQRERGNPHDTLRPKISASILRMHVKDGVERAKGEGLPAEIINIIREHHGRTIMESLYYKAKEEDRDVNEEDFRYEGPSPRTKESALVMLADAVEASVRSLDNPTSIRIRGQIEKIILKRVEEGELDNVDITMEDLKRIKDAFYPILMGIFHPRVAYSENKDNRLET
ncbi:hypothetical protein CH333_08410 [candidate division WOR-3 bacterium JGI_Cruoil_03_44_89]|mgnify:CR=1 FL=1|uniref:HD/PDEase domain-containing protein n=1 Tax=candidate division WOR-3 bacterium JGI_Cruoil_03_44_89 TaxID=1973748 RepID=A0A235BP59_UNCW3|nr:MAG: hypothetical protein CH333_08410 [candidate division WOR-3 bacterium JGI_Cruoil_03_44_89]